MDVIILCTNATLFKKCKAKVTKSRGKARYNGEDPLFIVIGAKCEYNVHVIAKFINIFH